MWSKYYYVLSHIKICSDEEIWNEWREFQENEIGVIELDVIIGRYADYNYGVEVLGGQPGNILLKKGDSILCVNENWTKAKINVCSQQSYNIYTLLNVLLFTHLSLRKALELHASLVNLNNKGLMFLGPSGIGKTTQAELWMKYRNAEIINGDMVFVKQEEDGFLGCGSPWHGSSPYCLNRQVPLAALVILKQSLENSIRRLTGFEMVSEVMNSVFFPTWYKEGHEAACKTLDALLRTVPVYELSCRPDEEAVRLTEEAVFGGSA